MYKVVVNGVVFFDNCTKDEAMDRAWDRKFLQDVAWSYGIDGKIQTVAVEKMN